MGTHTHSPRRLFAVLAAAPPAGFERTSSRARTYVRAVDSGCVVSDHFGMPAFPRCAALLRDGQPCKRTAAAGSEFCVHHTKLLASVDAETLRHGRTPKRHATLEPVLRVVTDTAVERKRHRPSKRWRALILQVSGRRSRQRPPRTWSS